MTWVEFAPPPDGLVTATAGLPSPLLVFLRGEPKNGADIGVSGVVNGVGKPEEPLSLN